MENIDILRLREDLMNYYGPAMVQFPFAMMDLIEVENASDEQLIEIAKRLNFDLDKYIIYTK